MSDIQLVKEFFKNKQFPNWLFEHSVNAAAVVAMIENSEDDILDNKLIIGALLHDTGRIFTNVGSKHTIAGYRILSEHESRCITHSFPTQNANDYQGENNCDSNEISFMNQILSTITLDDKKVILSDCYSTVQGVVTLNERFSDFDRRFPTQSANEIKMRNIIRRAYYEIENEIVCYFGIDISSQQGKFSFVEKRKLILKSIEQL